MGDTTKILFKRNGLYDAIHTSYGGYPDSVGRILATHHGDAALVEAMFAAADAADSRYVPNLGYGASPRFEEGERTISLPPFPAAELGARMAGYTFFLFDDRRWLWAGMDAYRKITRAKEDGAPLDEAAVIALMQPVHEAIAEIDRAREAERAEHDGAISEACAIDFGGMRFGLREVEGRWSVVRVDAAGERVMDRRQVHAMAHVLMLLSHEACTRQGISPYRHDEEDEPMLSA